MKPKLTPFRLQLLTKIASRDSWSIAELCGVLGKHACIVTRYVDDLVREGYAYYTSVAGVASSWRVKARKSAEEVLGVD